MAYGPPSWWGQAPIAGLKVKERQYRGSDGGYRPYMYDVTGLRRATAWDGYEGPGGVRLDSKGRVWGQYYEGGAERTVAGGGSGAGGGGASGGIPGIPGGSVMAQQAAAGLAEYKKALARLNQSRLGTLTQYGYKGEIDQETGVLKNMSIDSSNPFGVYQGLRRNNAFQYADLLDERMARGLGAKGLGAQGLDRARYQWGAADTAMAQALTGTLGSYDEQQQGAYQSYQNMLWQLQLEAARAAAEGGDFGYPYDDSGEDGEDGEDSPGVITDVPGTAPKSKARARAKRVKTKKGLAKYGWGAAGAYAKNRPLPGTRRNISPSVKATPAKAKAINKALKAAKKKGGKR